MKVQTYNLNGQGTLDENIQLKYYSEMREFKEFEDSIVLRVLQKDEERSFIKSTDMTDDEENNGSHFIIKKATDAIIRFSDCGKQLAIFWKE